MIKVACALVLLLSLGNLQAQDKKLLQQVQSIPLQGVEGRIDHMGADPQRDRLYVAALGNNSVEVIDLAAGKRINSIKGPKAPTGIRVLPAPGKVIVASGDDGKVRIYDTDLKLLGEIDGLDDADNVRLDPQGKTAFVGFGNGALAIIDPEQIKKVGEVKLDGHPEAFAIEEHGPHIFINVPTAHEIEVVDREKRTVVKKWPLKDAQSNFPMALDEPNHRLFIGCRQPAKVLIIDTETGKTVTSVDCCGDTDDLFYDPASKRIYVSGGAGSITIIEQTTADAYAPLGNVPTFAGARTSIFIPQTQSLFVAIPHRGSQQPQIAVYKP